MFVEHLEALKNETQQGISLQVQIFQVYLIRKSSGTLIISWISDGRSIVTSVSKTYKYEVKFSYEKQVFSVLSIFRSL